MNILLIAGTLLGLTGAFAVAMKRYMAGQIVWLFANALLFVVNLCPFNFWMLLLFGTYEVLTVFAIVNLLKKK